MAQSFAAKAYWLRSTALLCALSAPLITPAAYAETLVYSPNTHRQTLAQPPQNTATLIENPYQTRRSFIKSGQLVKSTVKPLRLPPQAEANILQQPPPAKPLAAPPAKPLKIVIPNIKPGEVKAAQTASAPAPAAPAAELIASAPPVASQPAPAPVEQASADNASLQEPARISTSFAAPQQYHSPGIIIRRHEVIKTGDRTLAMQQPVPDPAKLAQLSPAAGGDPSAMGTPLIPAPETAPKTLPAGELQPEPVASAQPREPQGPDDIVITDIITSHGVVDTGRSSETNSSNVDMMQALGVDIPMPQSFSGVPPLLPLLGKKGEQKSITASEGTDDSEPLPDLSNESKKIASKIPSNLDKPKNNRKSKIDVSHTKNLENIFTPPSEPETENVSRHETPGLSIEVRNRKANINYELEKAYNALVAGQTEAAIATYKSVLESDPKNTNALFGLATTYHRAGQVELARPLYGQILAIDPDNREALNNFMVLMADEAPQAALDQLERLEQRNPDFSPIPAQMAVIYQKLGDLGKASEKMFQAVALAPENLTYRYNLAVLMDKQQKYDEAVKLYRQMLEAYDRGETLPGSAQKIQERLTFISSNRR